MVLYPQNVDFKFDMHFRVLYMIIGVLAVFLTVVYVIVVSNSYWTTTIFSGLSILSESCNPLMPVAVVWAQSTASYWLRTDVKGFEENAKINTLVPPRIPIAGKSHVIVFDKTGTITKDGMDFMGVVPTKEAKFEETVQVAKTLTVTEVERPSLVDPSAESRRTIGESVDTKWLANLPEKLQYATGLCHTVTTLESDGSLVGNHVEVSMVQSSGWQLPAPGATTKTFTPPSHMSGLRKATVVTELPFDHIRMTSGVVVRHEDGSHDVFIKGSYEKTAAISMSNTVPGNFKEITAGLAADCYYVLGICQRSFDKGVDVASLTRDDLEKDLSFAGLLMFRNEMKPDSPEAIQEFEKIDF